MPRAEIASYLTNLACTNTKHRLWQLAGGRFWRQLTEAYMATKSKSIKGKILQEASTPSDANGKPASDAFFKLFGNRRFHSWQVWQESKDDRAAHIYGLSLAQLSTIFANSVKQTKATEDAASTPLPSTLNEKSDLSAELAQLRLTAETLTEENKKHREEKILQMLILNRLTHILPGGLRAIQRAIKDANSPNFYPDDLPPERAKSIKAILYPANGSQNRKIGRVRR